MTSKGHALSRDALIRTLTAYSGITTADGADGGTTLVDTNLKDNALISPSGIPEKTVLILSGDARGEDKGAASFNNGTGTITLQGTGFSHQIKAGTIFRVLNISSIEIDVANIQEDLGDMADAATADDMSDITTTSALAKLKRLLLRFSANAFSVSLDGSARTDIETLWATLATMLGTRDATVSAGVLADTESAFALLRRLATSGSLVHFGDITAVDAGVSSTIADLIGWEDDYFVGWWMTIVRDDGGAGAAPQGEYRMVTSYTSTTGLCAHAAFSVADAVGDQALLIHPALYAAIAMRGGTETLESIDDELDAMLDMAKEPSTNTLTGYGTEDPLFDRTGVVPFFIAGVWLGLENMVAGDTIRFRAYADWDDASIADQVSEDRVWTFSGAQSPKWVYMPLNIYVTYEFKVTGETITGTNREVYCVVDTGVRGS